MSKVANDENDELIKSKLEYIGLDLLNIPDFLKYYKTLDFRPSKAVDDEKKFNVYKYIDVNDIEILLTPKTRMDPLDTRYLKANYIYTYLQPEREEDLERHVKFLEMLRKVDIEEIKRLEQEQEKLKQITPFKVKFEKNYLWQIYYSDVANKYFMLVPTEDLDYAGLFFILKKKIESNKTGKEYKVFVPISYVEHSREYLMRSEYSDLEKYIWLFTKNWPLIYDVYDIDGKLSIEIVGNCVIYEKLTSFYNIRLQNKEKAVKFYKLLKALFILQTEIPHYFKFETKISSDCGLEFLFKNKVVTYENLARLLKEEYVEAVKQINENIIKNVELDNKLYLLKEEVKKKEVEFNIKQKEIVLYLESKKTFIGKVRYYLKRKNTHFRDMKIKKKEDVLPNKEDKKEIPKVKDTKAFYNIEDIIEIYKKLEIVQNTNKSLEMDINALEQRFKVMTLKVNNATIFINEIEKHVKSIFEFCRFCNKDELLALGQGEKKTEKEEDNKLEKTFDYEEDFESLGAKLDAMQREKLSKEELEALNIASTDILVDLNIFKYESNNKIKFGMNGKLENYQEGLDIIKNIANEERIRRDSQEFDIFGNIVEDQTKIKIIGKNKKHRENERNIFQSINITDDTTLEDYRKQLSEISQRIDSSLNKISLPIKINVYVASDNILNTETYEVFNIDPKNAIDKVKNLDKINLYRITLKKDMPVVAFTNIVFYDNKNKTLPIGMDLSDELLLDMSKINLELKRQKLFRLNQEVDEFNVQNKIICVYEYEVK